MLQWKTRMFSVGNKKRNIKDQKGNKARQLKEKLDTALYDGVWSKGQGSRAPPLRRTHQRLPFPALTGVEGRRHGRLEA
jgi:hypothetical protein